MSGRQHCSSKGSRFSKYLVLRSPTYNVSLLVLVLRVLESMCNMAQSAGAAPELRATTYISRGGLGPWESWDYRMIGRHARRGLQRESKAGLQHTMCKSIVKTYCTEIRTCRLSGNADPASCVRAGYYFEIWIRVEHRRLTLCIGDLGTKNLENLLHFELQCWGMCNLAQSAGFIELSSLLMYLERFGFFKMV